MHKIRIIQYLILSTFLHCASNIGIYLFRRETLRFTYQCSFFRQAIHLASLPALCYVAMRTQNPRNMQR